MSSSRNPSESNSVLDSSQSGGASASTVSEIKRTILVKPVTGPAFSVSVPSSGCVGDVKEAIFAAGKGPKADSQKLFVKGVPLKTGDEIARCIPAEATIVLVSSQSAKPPQAEQSISAQPSAKSASDEQPVVREKCKTCDFFGSPEWNGYCSKCFKKQPKLADEASLGVSNESANQVAESTNTVAGSSSDAASVSDHLAVASEHMASASQRLSTEASMMSDGAAGAASESSIAGDSLPDMSSAVSASGVASPASGVGQVSELAGSDTNSVHSSALSASQPSSVAMQQTDKTRCFACKKKIGLLGVECRCGFVFCSEHRYAERHACTYDYRANERKKLHKTNPVVMPEKMDRLI